jgi:hypothetical protein
MLLDIAFEFITDTEKGPRHPQPDAEGVPPPCGRQFQFDASVLQGYLCHASELGQFFGVRLGCASYA